MTDWESAFLDVLIRVRNRRGTVDTATQEAFDWVIAIMVENDFIDEQDDYKLNTR